MAHETIRLETRDGIALLTFDRQHVLNAFDPTLVHETLAAMEALGQDDTVRAIVVNGAGRAFSAGFDMKASAKLPRRSPQEWRRALELDFDFIMAFWNSPKPTIAAVHGPCIGGAFELALACDMTLAAEGTRFGAPEVRFGSGAVALLLPWMTGPKQAKEILLSGEDRLDAGRALALGIVNRVVPPDRLLDEAMALARTVATSDHAAVGLTKQAINRTYEIMGMRQALMAALEIGIHIESARERAARRVRPDPPRGGPERRDRVARRPLRPARRRRSLTTGRRRRHAMQDKSKDAGNDEWLQRVYTTGDETALAGVYDEWAKDYDAHLQGFGYRNTALSVGLVCRHVKPGDGEILDAACGTGLIGEHLHTLGYDALVGIDLSQGMLETSRTRGVYASLAQMKLGDRLDFEDGRFAAILAMGVLTIGHAPPRSLDELVRVTRPGGTLIFSLPLPAYEDGGFKEKIAELAAAGAWSLVEATRDYRVLPGSASEGEMLSRIHVYRRAG